jgi:hypothetical protein
MTTSVFESFGLVPANIKWTVVRGDTAELKIDFLQDDEVTTVDISDWTFEANAYDIKGEATDELEVTVGNGYVVIVAASDITENWGVGYGSVVGELGFDLQVAYSNKTWTPVVGTIKVLGDVTGAGL